MDSVVRTVYVARVEGTRLLKCAMLKNSLGIRVPWGGQGGKWMKYLHSDQPVDDRCDGRGEMDTVFYYDHDCTRACSSISEHDEKEQGDKASQR